MADVLLTGASGFVGQHLTGALTARGHRVTCLRGRDRGDANGAGGLLDAGAIAAAMQGVGVVVHLAAATGKVSRDVSFRTNVEGTRALVNAASAAGSPRFILASTIAVTFADTRRYWYAQSKAQAESLVAESGLPYAIVRPTIVAGTGSPVMTGLARLARLPVIPAFAGARARVQPIHVDDLCALLVDLVEAPEYDRHTLEMGGREIVPLRDLLSRMHQHATRHTGRFVSVPVAPVIPLLALLERVALAATPLTVGQLATFRFDGVARPNPLWQARSDSLRDIGIMVAEAMPS